jgi:hypothetical protein
MILTPIPREELAGTLDRFMAGLPDRLSRAVFRQIRATSPDRAAGAEAEQHRLAALAIARGFGLPIHPEVTACRFNWDGAALNGATEAYVILHEVAHFALAPPERRELVEFGPGASPDTLDCSAAERTTVLSLEREADEAAASLLGIVWGWARAAGAHFVPRSELARRARPIGGRPFHCSGQDITTPRLAQCRASACCCHSSHGRPSTALLVALAFAASSALRKLTSPWPSRNASAWSLALISV